MLQDNKELFEEFRVIHDSYALNETAHQENFNEIGKKVMVKVREYEDRLCGRSEGSGYGVYSGNLAEKFQQEVRKLFPKIDWVGIKVTKAAPEFSIKKISLQ